MSEAMMRKKRESPEWGEDVREIDLREATSLYGKVVDYVLQSREPIETIASKLSMIGFLQSGFMLVEERKYRRIRKKMGLIRSHTEEEFEHDIRKFLAER